MAIVLVLWGILAAAAGVVFLAGSMSAIHEILAAVAFLIATVSVGLGAVVSELAQIRKRLPEPEGHAVLADAGYQSKAGEVAF